MYGWCLGRLWVRESDPARVPLLGAQVIGRVGCSGHKIGVSDAKTNGNRQYGGGVSG